MAQDPKATADEARKEEERRRELIQSGNPIAKKPVKKEDQTQPPSKYRR